MGENGDKREAGHRDLGHAQLTRVEVFGLGQLDGGSGLLLQLHDGLASFADDGARGVAGDEHLQEVFAFLCRDTQGGGESGREAASPLEVTVLWHPVGRGNLTDPQEQ